MVFRRSSPAATCGSHPKPSLLPQAMSGQRRLDVVFAWWHF
jgi:hypothetical protein